MFENIRKNIWEKRLDKEQIEFDKKKRGNTISNLYGEWEDGRRVYDNGCYCIPCKKLKNGDWQVVLYAKDGKSLCSCEMTNIINWHHGFVMVDAEFCNVDTFFDCDGNMICGGDGVFLSDKDEFGENIYAVPIHSCKKYLLYNHETRKIVKNTDGNILRFDGLRGSKDGRIVGVISGENEGSGYGTLREITYYDMVYIIDYDGNICDCYKANERKVKNGE